jgi:3-hydroxyacyl-CoA dehydrogenase
MSEGRSAEFRDRVQLFNPARYLKLFEIIPGPATSQGWWTSPQYF